MSLPAKIVVILGIVLIVLGGLFYYTSRVAEAPESEVPTETPPAGGVIYESSSTGFSFAYPDTYVLVRAPESSELLEGVTLMIKSDYEELEASTEPREGPPSITVMVYNNALGASPSQWVMAQPQLSNYGVATSDVLPTLVSGMEAVRYSWSGLYQGESVAVSHQNRIYIFSASWLTPEDPQREDLETVLSSVVFK